MDFFIVRRVRVRPEFASRYPELVPGVWISATRAARMIRQADRMQQRVHDCGCRRVMCDLHFEFRGGRKREGGTGVRRSRAEYHGPYKLGNEGVLI